MRSFLWPVSSGVLMFVSALGCSQAPAPEGVAANGEAGTRVISGRYPGLEREPEPEAAATAATPTHLRPVVTLRTSAGDITLRLNAEAAPVTVANFLRYVDAGHYHDVVFHQVVDGYMILGGGQTADQREKPAQPPIRNEAHNGLSNRRGTIAMARSPESIDSATCQFFINLVDNAHLDHQGRTAEEYGYCVFGEVIEGLEVVDKIGKTPVRDAESHAPLETVSIRGALRR
jgi:peptidyl-prolyl cis-trans isomerase B (cyclophilin B)